MDTSESHALARAGSNGWPLPVFLLGVNVAFLLAHTVSFALAGDVPGLVYLDREGNLPTWWSSAQLLLSGLSLGLVAVRCWRVRRAARALALFAALLVLMSVDEAAALHEWLGRRIDDRLGGRSTLIFHFTGVWFLVLGLPFVLAVAIMLRHLSSFLSDVPGSARRLAVGVAILLCGAVGVEALSNFAVPQGLEEERFHTLRYNLSVAAEEFLEMTGGSVLLWTSLDVARGHWSTRGVVEVVRPLTLAEAARLQV